MRIGWRLWICVRLFDESEKEAADTIRGAEIEQCRQEREAAAHDYEHLTHVNEVGLHEARVLHADQMHREVVRHHETHVARVAKGAKRKR